MIVGAALAECDRLDALDAAPSFDYVLPEPPDLDGVLAAP
jgi:hypothetical protein